MHLRPTESELEILQILWESGPATVRTVNDALNAKREVGYTTTLKMMQIMKDKGLLTRERNGKTHIYQPAVAQETTRKALLDRFVENTFGGSAMQLVMQALGNGKTSAADIDQIRAYLDEIENETGK
ncbi:MAG: BlaI/MecI/CopY family transcriptional regulator [Bacteroidota bacterium]